eukprot:UN08107
MSTSAQTIYSLWMCPPPEISDKLRKIISILSKQHDTIAFEPHITLMHAIFEFPTAMVMNKVEELCNKLTPFIVKLKHIGYGKPYFQSLYILIELTSELITANSICRKLFCKYDEPKYMPHLSLLYCDPNQVPKDIHNEIDLKEQDISEFMIDSVELWLTPAQKNQISEWDMVKRFTFKNQSKLSKTNINQHVNDMSDEKELFAKDWGECSALQNSRKTSNNLERQLQSKQHQKVD